MKKIALTLFSLTIVLSQNLFAQDVNPDFMRSIGKIYVVVAVIVAMFIGIVFFLIYLDRKITKLENQIISND